jgi:hypothetical protein
MFFVLRYGNNVRTKEKAPSMELRETGEVVLFSFLWYGNNVRTKEKAPSMELRETRDVLGCYSYVKLSNFPLPMVLLCHGTKYNNIEWNSFSSYMSDIKHSPIVVYG